MARERSDEDLVYGVHPVRELLESRPERVERLYVVPEVGRRLGGSLRVAREAGIPVTHLRRELLARKVGRAAAHQGVAARVAPVAYADADELCEEAARRAGGLLVLADGVVDPRNLGAMLRTAAGAGVDGILLGGDSTVGLTATVAKTSAGAIERVAVAREPKPARRLEALRERGFGVYGLSPGGSRLWSEVDLRGRIVIVAGGESRGLRPGLARACEALLAIPLSAGVESLNVAVALGVLLFEAVRQRRSVRTGS